MSERGALPIGLFIAVLLFYLYTLAPTVTWADGARLQTEAILGGSSYLLFEEASQPATDGWPFDRLGVAAWDHPLYVMLGRVFSLLPLGDPPYRINLMSALAATITIVLVYRIGFDLTGDRWAAVLGAIGLAVSHTFWFHAVTAEVYAPYALFMISLIGLARRWPLHQLPRDLMLFALLAGLGLATHLMLAPTIFMTTLYIATASGIDVRQFRLRELLRPRQSLDIAVVWDWKSVACIGLFVAGFAPWWIQFLRMSRWNGISLTLRMAAGYPWIPGGFALPSVQTGLINLLIYMGWLIYQFTPFGVAFGVCGMIYLIRTKSRMAAFLLALYLVHAALSANYSAPDRFALHLPSYLIFALFIVCGIAALKRELDARLANRAALQIGWRGLVLVITCSPVVMYALTPRILPAMGYTEARLGIQPIGTGARDTLRYFLDPNRRGDDSTAVFGHSTFAQLAPDALVLTPRHSDGEVYVVLRYFQLVEHLRPDVHIELVLFESSDTVPAAILELVHSQIPCHPIYLASLNERAYPLAALRAEFDIVPEANLFRLRPRQPLPAAPTCPDLHRRWAGLPLDQLIADALQHWR